jgi:DNA-binding NtrC family response regulator
MVVDDEPDVLDIIASHLETQYDVLTADRGDRALDLLAVRPDTVLLISDIRMPEMSGVVLAEKATAIHAGLRVILMSGFADQAVLPFPLLRKPFRMPALSKFIAAVLDG